MVRYPEFRKALYKWRRAAKKYLNDDPEPTVTRIDLQQWGRHNDGSLRKVDSLHWNYAKLNATYELKEFTELVKAANRYPDIRKHLNVLVGGPYSSRSFSLQDITTAFLPKLQYAADGEHVDLIPRPASLYKHFEEFIANNKIRVTTLWPIAGLQLEKPIKIREGVVIRRLTEDELITALSFGIIRTHFPNMPIFPEHESNQSGLFYTHELTKIIGDNRTQDIDVAELEQEKGILLENVITAAAVVDIRGIRFNGRAEASQGWPLGFSSASWSGNQSSSNPAFANKVDSKKINHFQKTWELLFSHGGSVDKSLYLAARRLAFAEERIRTDDTLLDLMIAAEALYLGSDGANRGELKFRLALRVAHWADPSRLGATKKEIFELMKAAYDARSAIAHGGTPKQKYLRFKGQQLQQVEFNKLVENTIRQGLQKAIKQAAKTENRRFMPSWDDRIITRLSR